MLILGITQDTLLAAFYTAINIYKIICIWDEEFLLKPFQIRTEFIKPSLYT